MLASATVMVLVMTTAGPASAAGPEPAGPAGGGPTAAEWAVLKAQGPLLEAGTAIWELSQREGFEGFTGTSVAGGKLTVYWHGEVPEKVSALVASTSRQKGFPAELRAAPYSYRELDAEAYRLANLPGVTAAGILADFSGLFVGYEPARIEAVGKDALRSLAPASAFKIEVGASNKMLPAARWDDTSPFKGGAAIEHRSGFWPFYSYTHCSSGFAARRASDNAEVMITARHCGPNWEWHIAEGSEQSLGTSSSGLATYDAMYISGGDYQPRVYTGDSSSNTSIAINGYSFPSVGMMVCYEGAFSGASCSNYAQSPINLYIPVEGIGTVGPGFWTEKTSHTTGAAGQGDSGGPALVGSSGSGLNGMGIITAIDGGNVVTCQGRGDRKCSWRVFAINLVASLVQQGLNLQTST